MNKILLSVVIVITIVFVSFGAFWLEEISEPKAAVIPVNGAISFSSLRGNPANIAEQVEKAKGNPAVEAFVFKINSPGGSVVASRQIHNLIKKIDKPTTCWLGDVAASGAYWVASGCDEIIADPLTLTGSIGVSASYLEYSGLMKQFGVEYQRLVTGKYKDIGSPYRNLTEEERRMFNDTLEKVLNYFTTSISQERNLTESQIEELTKGSFYLGEEAKDLDLVDHLGGKEKVKEILKEKTGKDLKFKYYKKEFGIFDLVKEMLGSSSSNLEKLILKNEGLKTIF